MDNKKIPTVLGAIVLAIVAITAGAFVYRYEKMQDQGTSDYSSRRNKLPGGGTVCAQDAKICPNGLAVSRTGPTCEFAKCPNAEAESVVSDWKVYRNEEYGFEFKYPEKIGDKLMKLGFLSDSRNAYDRDAYGEFSVLLKPEDWQDAFFQLSVFNKDVNELISSKEKFTNIENFRKTPIEIENKEGTLFLYDYIGNEGRKNNQITYLPLDNNTIVFSGQGDIFSSNSGKISNPSQELWQNIFSTFKLTR